MAAKKKAKEDMIARQIRDRLVREYVSKHSQARVDVKRVNPVCVRVRVLDPDFAGQDRADRDDAIWDILDTLPEDVRGEVSLLVLLTPKEAKTSMMNDEFENPVYSEL